MIIIKYLGILTAAISVFNIITKIMEADVHGVIENAVQVYYAIILPLTALANYLLNEALDVIGYSLPPINPDWFALFTLTTASFIRSFFKDIDMFGYDDSVGVGERFLMVVVFLFLWPFFLAYLLSTAILGHSDNKHTLRLFLVELLKVIVLAMGFLAINGALVS